VNAEDLFQEGLNVIRPSALSDPVAYLKENVKKIPAGVFDGGYNPKRWPWIGEAVRIFNAPTTSRMFMPWAIGCGKTLTLKLCATYLMANRRASMAIFLDSQDKAKAFTLNELRPLFDQVADIRSQMSGDDNDKSGTLRFADGSLIHNRSASTEKHLQSLHVRYVFGSEIWQWPNGALAMSMSRMKAAAFASKAIYESQPGDIEGQGAEFWKFYLMTDQREWMFVCPNQECQHRQPWLWDYIRFPEGAKMTDGWDLEAVQHGTTYECSKCRHRMEDNDEVRTICNEVERGAGFEPTAKAEKAGYVGLHVNALASTSWGSLAVDMIKAKQVADLVGDQTPRMLFKNQYLALPWSDDGTGSMVVSTESSDYAMDDPWEAVCYISPRGQIVNKDEAPEGSVKFITLQIDCQGDHFWVVVRQWARTGHSRLMYFGKVNSTDGIGDWSGLDALAVKYGVHPQLVMVDSGGQDQTTQTVYKQCATRGWYCSKGSGQEYFNVKTKAGDTVRRFYNTPTAIHVPGVRTPTALVVWSNLSGKDLFHGMRARKVFTFARDADPGYVEQLNSEVRVKEAGKAMWRLRKGVRDNHAFDCELLGMLIAARWGLLGRDEPQTLPQTQ
jgi:phage terminase large subunit GpA-like protein